MLVKYIAAPNFVIFSSIYYANFLYKIFLILKKGSILTYLILEGEVNYRLSFISTYNKILSKAKFHIALAVMIKSANKKSQEYQINYNKY